MKQDGLNADRKAPTYMFISSINDFYEDIFCFVLFWLSWISCISLLCCHNLPGSVIFLSLFYFVKHLSWVDLMCTLSFGLIYNLYGCTDSGSVARISSVRFSALSISFSFINVQQSFKSSMAHCILFFYLFCLE